MNNPVAFKAGDKVLIETTYGSRSTTKSYAIDYVKTITPKRGDIKLRSGRVFRASPFDDARYEPFPMASYRARYDHLLPFDFAVWNLYRKQIRMRNAVAVFDWNTLSEEHLDLVLPILETYTKPDRL